MANCPYCAETLKETVGRCPSCGETLSAPALRSAETATRSVSSAEEGSAQEPERPKDVRALADFLGLSIRDLYWLGDAGRLTRNPHYRVLVRPKRRGGRRFLLMPKKRLKAAQAILHEKILSRIAPSAWAHGFTRGRSILTHAAQHLGKAVLAKMDLKDFFHAVHFSRVAGLLRSLEFSAETAHWIALLTTFAPSRFGQGDLPPGVGVEEFLEGCFPGPVTVRTRNHRILPQGAPTSPALANLVARGLDRRSAALARRFHAAYSRYADDLAFSGDAELSANLTRFLHLAREIILDEGFRPAREKQHIVRKTSRQMLTGIVVNQRLNVARESYRQLRAILHNCVTKGPDSQNRAAHPDFAAHLRGRIAFVRSVHPDRGARLLDLFGRIPWNP